jgi:tetratricopeptide (TPR) repeat protein
MWILLVAAFLAAAAPSPLELARDVEDRVALEKIVDESAAAATKAPHDAEAQYRLALASSYLSEVALELKDKKVAEQAAVRGVQAAELTVMLKPDMAEYYRLLGTLCGQVVPANILTGLSYGKRAKDNIDKAIAKDPKSSMAYMSRGVGNYYLPAALGGGPELAVADFRKAIELDAKNAEAWMWLGLGLRKENKDGEARQALQKSLELNPRRVWAKQQLEKTR